MVNQEKGYAEKKVQKIQDGGGRHLGFFRLVYFNHLLTDFYEILDNDAESHVPKDC
jgi:hypothetical protein